MIASDMNVFTAALDDLRGLTGGNAAEASKNAAEKALEYAADLDAGKISKTEFVDLLADLKVEEIVGESADTLTQKILLKQAISGLISVMTFIPL